jgi:hypothetical protein
MRLKFFLTFLIRFVFVSLAHAYPEMVRHNYVNCTSCHVSPSGGGILNDYGRELSKEVLSTWSKDGEQAFIYGFLKSKENLKLGGDYRSAVIYQDQPSFKEIRGIQMQADVEAALVQDKWVALATIGYQDPRVVQVWSDHTISRRHWIGWKPSEKTLIRTGRFMIPYGINIPEHVTTIRRGLGFDQSAETYNIGFDIEDEKWSASTTLNLGRIDQPSLNREQGVALTAAIPIGESAKLGYSYLWGTSSLASRNLMGPYVLLGFSSRLYLLSELYFQFKSTPSIGSTTGGVNYQKLGYELMQGLVLYGTQEWSKLDFSNPNSLQTNYGLGVQFFPRPHFEFNFSYQKQLISALSSTPFDFAWLMFHYYL